MNNRLDPSYWRSVRRQDIIRLSDQQTIEFVIKNKMGLPSDGGINFVVKDIKRIRSGMIEWQLFEINYREITWHVLVKSVDGSTDLRIYFKPDNLEFGGREDIVNQGFQWLFKEPADAENFDTEDLEYADVIFENENEVEIEYRQKGQGIVYGDCFSSPRTSSDSTSSYMCDDGYSGNKTMAAVVEYMSMTDCENPELITIELGDDDKGGYVMFFQGCSIDDSDIEVVRS